MLEALYTQDPDQLREAISVIIPVLQSNGLRLEIRRLLIKLQSAVKIRKYVVPQMPTKHPSVQDMRGSRGRRSDSDLPSWVAQLRLDTVGHRLAVWSTQSFVLVLPSSHRSCAVGWEFLWLCTWAGDSWTLPSAGCAAAHVRFICSCFRRHLLKRRLEVASMVELWKLKEGDPRNLFSAKTYVAGIPEGLGPLCVHHWH